MKSLAELLRGQDEWRVVITDSGLGGLSICAALARRLRGSAESRPVRLTYVNAWPDAGLGYNDLPDIGARAAVFDRALAAMTAFRPGLILIACNTLSVVYEATAFSRAPAAPVAGIIDAGVDLFAEALGRKPDAALALFGTRTTIGSGEHVRRLALRGVDAGRVLPVACHGLAGAIDKDPGAPELAGLVDECVGRALRGRPPGGPLFAGLACTHYAYVADLFRAALSQHDGTGTEILDPNQSLVDALVPAGTCPGTGGARAFLHVEVVSKVELPEAQRRAVARRLEPVSALTARALIEYTHVPGFF
jgi:glutamate racemase